MAPAPKILVVRGGALGDFLLTLPVLAALRQRFPGCDLEVLGYEHIAALAVAGGLADRVAHLESPALAPFFVRDGDLPERDARYFGQFNLIVSYIFDPERIFQSSVARCSAARFIVGPFRPEEFAGIHATEALLRPLRAVGISNADSRPRLNLKGERKPLPGPCLAVHPGSGSAQKNWPEWKWSDLLSRVAANTEWHFLLVGGEAEAGRSERLATVLPPGRAHLAQNLPLPELAQTMLSCTAFIGHDSGVTHLAAALDLPGLVMWGPSNAAVWRPVSDKMRLLRDPAGLQTLPVETVFHEVEALSEGR